LKIPAVNCLLILIRNNEINENRNEHKCLTYLSCAEKVASKLLKKDIADVKTRDSIVMRLDFDFIDNIDDYLLLVYIVSFYFVILLFLYSFYYDKIYLTVL